MRKLLQKILIWIYPELRILKDKNYDFTKLRSWYHNVRKGKNVRINTVALLDNVEIGDFSYLSDNAIVTKTQIGKFCSIGPNFLCGWGAHPTNGISTSPVFYSKDAQFSLTDTNKFEEHSPIHIGNDVFIGANVIVLEGVTIGDGAIIGAGAVVSKDIPPYAIAVGCPIQIKRYRFTEKQCEQLQRMEWWNYSEEQLQDVEGMFYDVDQLIAKYDEA